MKTDVETKNPYSLIGAAMLWSGMTNDRQVLHEAPVVVKVGEPRIKG